MTSNQLEEITHHLETEFSSDKRATTKWNKKRRTYKKYLRKIQTEYLPRKQKYETYNHIFQEQNSFSKTDTDATFMRMKDN